MGQILEIHIEIAHYQREDQKRLKIRIWDSGNGFSPSILEELQNIDSYLETENYHIGISNVLLRSRHVFKDPSITFSNRPEAGAQIDIDLPFQSFQNSKEIDS